MICNVPVSCKINGDRNHYLSLLDNGQKADYKYFTSQLLIALEYKICYQIDAETKFFYSVVKCVNYLIVINEDYRSKIFFQKKKHQGSILISQNSFTQWFNIQTTKYK